MKNKWDSFMSSAGFYVTMAVCLAVAGVSGYFLLLDKDDPKPTESTVPPVQETASSTTTTEIVAAEEPEEKPVAIVETMSPDSVKVEVEVVSPIDEEVEEDTEDAVAEEEVPSLVVSPLEGEVLTVFSVDELLYNETLGDWRIHDGVDISAKPGTTVLAACAGTVYAVEDDTMMGTTVVISHADGYQTTYANLQETPTVEIGDSVSAGQIIGAVGTTAMAESSQNPHLHFSVTKDGDAVDPDVFLNQK